MDVLKWAMCLFQILKGFHAVDHLTMVLIMCKMGIGLVNSLCMTLLHVLPVLLMHILTGYVFYATPHLVHLVYQIHVKPSL